MKKYFSLILIAVSLSVVAQETAVEKHLIDIALEKCIREADYNEKAIAQCLMEALKSWKAEVEKNYQQLYAVLDEPNRKELEEAKKQWQEYEGSENVLARGLYGHKNKYPYGIVPISRSIDLLKMRAADLKEYYDLLGRR
ncbi:lysozyme inhibitor LprI family protein [Flavobacterium sp. MFBS3-15]|uniref:lysozyme inhibitor LprI family protein n=1 Tax=Flavobacterium sp. MFBS3-15 TaxID=2989816 RepID=UPI0022358684|nr:lysozyme inhibitor LprI family protein [Flavobacterium sp. MFBS3-15]MCW4469059.1 lysozyme inhibitor LprI family protein [Flavobacterium sp. MFBS3-15]